MNSVLCKAGIGILKYLGRPKRTRVLNGAAGHGLCGEDAPSRLRPTGAAWIFFSQPRSSSPSLDFRSWPSVCGDAMRKFAYVRFSPAQVRRHHPQDDTGILWYGEYPRQFSASQSYRECLNLFIPPSCVQQTYKSCRLRSTGAGATQWRTGISHDCMP
ncbi:hypothetical protein N658DRAFT_116173 [Parathielavia hyrcaniae]|uniref:Uncharacterized protein n=1 Tax=Parathielavia hyrcaniae TaxID=113614 RepID=A0AAN6Q841_9PEZI|nr:hypothetical protein N658DRAFT_116173 [Parathielavia hyrcaniae]